MRDFDFEKTVEVTREETRGISSINALLREGGIKIELVWNIRGHYGSTAPDTYTIRLAPLSLADV